MSATDERMAKLGAYRAALAQGCSPAAAQLAAGVSDAWVRRWSDKAADLGGLVDAPRSGRPRMAEATDADRAALARAYMRSNAGKGRGSMTSAARILAKRGSLSAPLAAAILKPRASKCDLPTAVVEACQVVAPAAIRRYRDPNADAAAIAAEGVLRMSEDGRRLRPGERHVWDDLTVNVGVVVPWTRGGDPCSEKFGVRLARFQLLGCIDCATDKVVGYSYVVRSNDAYSGVDVARAFHGVWQAAGYLPREVVLEGGSWQGKRALGYLQAAGVRVVSAKGRPHQKLIERFFNCLHTAMSVTLDADGHVGRYRGEMVRENKHWLAAREGKVDPRKHFPSLNRFLLAADEAVKHLDSEPIKSRVYNDIWVPNERYAGAAANGLGCYMPELWRLAMPVIEERAMKRGGVVTVRAMCPFEYEFDYSFAWADSYKYEGKKVRVAFDPDTIRSGAVIMDASGKVLTWDADCISPAPDPLALTGWHDNAEAVSRVRRKSRALVSETVAAFDERGKRKDSATIARGVSPRGSLKSRRDYQRGEAAHLAQSEDAELAIKTASHTAERTPEWFAKMEAKLGLA